MPNSSVFPRARTVPPSSPAPVKPPVGQAVPDGQAAIRPLKKLDFWVAYVRHSLTYGELAVFGGSLVFAAGAATQAPPDLPHRLAEPLFILDQGQPQKSFARRPKT